MKDSCHERVMMYRIHSSREETIITGGSAFNIKAESLRLGDFSRPEVEELYQHHTDETGQSFAPEAMELVWKLSEGQPWLVNALGYEVCFKRIGTTDGGARKTETPGQRTPHSSDPLSGGQFRSLVFRTGP